MKHKAAAVAVDLTLWVFFDSSIIPAATGDIASLTYSVVPYTTCGNGVTELGSEAQEEQLSSDVRHESTVKGDMSEMWCVTDYGRSPAFPEGFSN